LSLEEHRRVDVDSHIFIDAMELFWAARDSWSHGFGTLHSWPRFFRELTQRASANGWLRLWMLRIKGRPVASEYQVGSNGALYALRRDHDPSVREVSVPQGLEFSLVRALFAQGAPLDYYLGLASVGGAWASGAHEHMALDVYAPTAYGRLLHSLETRRLPWAS